MEGKAGKGAFGSPPLCKCVFKTNYNAAIRQSICSRTRLLTPASWVPLSWARRILGNEGTVVCRRLLMEERISFKKDIFYFPICFFSQYSVGSNQVYNILQDNLALSFYKLEYGDRKGLTVTTFFTMEKDRAEGNTTTPTCLYVRTHYR